MHVSALQAGMIGLPNAVLSAIASLWCGRQALTRGRNLVIVGLSCILVGVLGSIGMAKDVYKRQGQCAPICEAPRRIIPQQ